jgi:arsenate reductase
MSQRPINVLFLCTGNSARSILAETLANKWGQGRVQAFSAGSHPSGRVNPLALELLAERGYPTDGLRSKSWDEFAAPGAAAIDVIVTVCDNAAGEVCPIWPGKPVTAHWGIPDPAAVEGSDSERRLAFQQAYGALEARIKRFLALPLEALDPPTLKARMKEIGAAEAEKVHS